MEINPCHPKGPQVSANCTHCPRGYFNGTAKIIWLLSSSHWPWIYIYIYNCWKKVQTQVICTTMVSWIIPIVRQSVNHHCRFTDSLTIGIIHETMVVHMTWIWTFFNNYSNHPRMCVLSTLCGNVDKHSPFDFLYIYIYIYIYIIQYIHEFTTNCNATAVKHNVLYIILTVPWPLTACTVTGKFTNAGLIFNLLPSHPAHILVYVIMMTALDRTLLWTDFFSFLWVFLIYLFCFTFWGMGG